ncbi:phage baseplate plug family protein [Mesorhizobium sp. P5_C1]
MVIIPLQAVPNQAVSVTLGNQVSQVNIYQKDTGLFIDLFVDNTLVIGGVICQNLNRIVRSVYLGFSGDLVFIDNQGDSDPVFSGLGTRYSLAYLSPADLLAGQG